MRYSVLGLFISALIASAKGLPVEGTTTISPATNGSTTSSSPLAGMAEKPTIPVLPETTLASTSTVSPQAEKSAGETHPSPTEKVSGPTPTVIPHLDIPIAPKEATTTVPTVSTGKPPAVGLVNNETFVSTTEKTSATSTPKDTTFNTGNETKPTTTGGMTTPKPHTDCCSGKKNETKTTDIPPPLDISNEGKIIVFNGICGPDGCKVKGDIYGEFPPLFSK